MRHIHTSIALVALVALAPHARADGASPSKQDCVSAYVDGQKLKKADKLTEAKQRLTTCAHPACPASLQKDCQPWLAELERDLPSLSFEALDLGGSKTDRARVEIDGKPLGDSLPSGPVDLDPGKHQLRFQLAGAQPIDLQVEVGRGEKGKSVVADFSKQGKPSGPAPIAPAPVETRAKRPVPPVVWILGGVGVVGLASFAYFGSKGKSEEDDLASTCAPNCKQEDVDSSHRKFLYADLSLGVALVSFGAATYFYLTRPEKKASETTVGLSPLPRGAGAVVRGAF